MKKLIAMLGAVVAAVTSAFAADLLVSWEGDFKTESKVGTDGKTYTLALNDNTVAEDGSTLTVSQAKAPTITLSSQMGQHISVIMKYSGYTTPSSRTAFLSLSPSGCNDVGLTATSEKLSGFWNNNGTEYGPQTMTAPASGLAVLSYSCSTDNKGTFGYIGTINADGTISYSGRIGVVGLRFTNASYNMDGKTVNLGGVSNTGSHPSMQNLVIEKVAIFSGLFEANNDATLTGFVWPNYQRWASNPAVLTWAKTGSGAQAFHEGPFKLFSIKGGMDTTPPYTTTAAQLPGQTANITPWHVFCTTGGYKYIAPGYVLRLAPGYSAGNLNATFNNMTFGGLIVEKGATGYTFNSTGDRTSGLGDTRANGGVETWYEIHEDLSYARQGAFTLHGTLNFDIDAGKTLDLNSARSEALTLSASSHGCIKLHGAGNLKVNNLTASGAVTLDYTDVDLSREDAYVTGTITLGTATTIRLPAMEVAVGDSVKLATTLEGSIDTTKVLVGGEADENILWTIDGGALVATQAPNVVTIGENGYVSLGKALAAVEGTATITLAADIIGRNETIPAGVTIELAGHAITGTLDIKAGAVITDGGVAKIDGIATSFDATFNDPEHPGAFKFKEESGVTLQYDTVDSRSTPLFVNEDPISKDTGITLKNHPYFNNIPAAWFNNTLELTLAVVGTMTEATRTTFIHMGTTTNNGKGLLLATGDKKDEVIVAWNNGTTVNIITRMQVPNAASSRHVYVVTKKDDPETNKTTFTVYLDNIKWKTLVVDKFTIVGGVQVGSDFGGQIYRYATGDNLYHNVTADVGLINAIRLYDRVISPAEIAQYSVAAEYPYVSPNGSSARTVAGEANWIAETEEWSNTPAGETEAVAAIAPLAGDIDLTASGAATISVNVAEDATCEMLTLKGSAMTFTAGEGGSLAPSAATIGVPVTVKPGSLDLSKANITIVGDGKIVADYATMDLSSILTTTTVYVTGEIDQQEDGIVTLVKPTAAGRTVGDLAYDETTSQYGFTVTPVMVNVTVTPVANMTATVAAGSLACTATDGVAAVPYGTTITVTYAPVTGYHTVEGAVTTVTIENVTEEQTVDATSITPVEINMYTVPVTHVENATTYVSVGGEEFEVVTAESIQVAHGKSFSAKYVANEGYMLVLPEGDTEPFKTEGYNYGSVTFNTADYPVHCAAVKIAAKIGETPYRSVQAAIDAAQEGDEIVLVDETAEIPEGYIVKDGKVVAKPTIPTAVATEITAEADLEVAYEFTLGDVVEGYDDYEANFEVSFGSAVKIGDVQLKGNYGSYGWVGFDMVKNLAAKEVWKLLPSSGAGSVNYGEVVSVVQSFKCGVVNLKAAEGTMMKVELVLIKGEEKLVLATVNHPLGEPQATDLPGAEEVPADQKDAYNAWAEKNGVTESTTTDTMVLATAFAMNVSLTAAQIEAGVSIEEAAQQAVEDEVPSIDMAELVAGNLEDAVKAINEKYNGKVEASLVEVTEGTLKSTETAKFYKLSITILK